MVKMREAVGIYDQRYHKGKGVKTVNMLGLEVNESVRHDMIHLMVAGVPFLMQGKKNVAESLECLEGSGCIDRASGIKAELLVYIYISVFDGLDRGHEISFDKLKRSLRVPAVENSQMMSRYRDWRNDAGKNYSHIPQLDDLIRSYEKNKTAGVELFICDEEIRFHMRKAEELYQQLKESNPKCVVGGGLDYEKLLDLNIRKFKIDNFTKAEKIKLRGANLSVSGNLSR